MKKHLITLLWFLFSSLITFAQNESDEKAMIHFDQGLGFNSPDTNFGVNIRFRMQNLLMVTTKSGDDPGINRVDARVRRLRLRFDGYLGKNERLTYYIQLAFSREDQDWDNSHIPNIVRDAMLYYTFSKDFYIGFGQGKLPGNRQRIISSGQQQFLDRSLVNSIFNIDRDFGFFMYYTLPFRLFPTQLKAAVSTGEGRGTLKTDDGLSYTARLEMLPLGQFTRGGDFLEGDLLREPHPRLGIGLAYNFNHKATRTQGQRGFDLFQPHDIKSFFADIIFKYRGWALETEYSNRYTDLHRAMTAEGDTSTLFSGQGVNFQVSYYFSPGIEIAGRYSRLMPDAIVQAYEPCQNIYTLGLTRYLFEHKVKILFNLSYRDLYYYDGQRKNDWQAGVMAEIGI